MYLVQVRGEAILWSRHMQCVSRLFYEAEPYNVHAQAILQSMAMQYSFLSWYMHLGCAACVPRLFCVSFLSGKKGLAYSPGPLSFISGRFGDDLSPNQSSSSRTGFVTNLVRFLWWLKRMWLRAKQITAALVSTNLWGKAENLLTCQKQQVGAGIKIINRAETVAFHPVG